MCAVRFPDGTCWRPVSGDVSEIQYPDGAHYWGQTQQNSPGGFGLFEADDIRVLGTFAGEELRGPGLLTGVAGTASGSFQGAQLTGYGAVSQPAEDLYFAGEFRGGKPEGLGTLIHRRDSSKNEITTGDEQNT